MKKALLVALIGAAILAVPASAVTRGDSPQGASPQSLASRVAACTSGQIG